MGPDEFAADRVKTRRHPVPAKAAADRSTRSVAGSWTFRRNLHPTDTRVLRKTEMDQKTDAVEKMLQEVVVMIGMNRPAAYAVHKKMKNFHNG